MMEGAILHTESDKDLALILQLAKKLGISARKLSEDEIEDYGLSIAISEGKTGEYIDTETFLSELRDGDQDRYILPERHQANQGQISSTKNCQHCRQCSKSKDSRGNPELKEDSGYSINVSYQNWLSSTVMCTKDRKIVYK
jgi:hypothetical protein